MPIYFKIGLQYSISIFIVIRILIYYKKIKKENANIIFRVVLITWGGIFWIITGALFDGVDTIKDIVWIGKMEQFWRMVNVFFIELLISKSISNYFK